MIDNNIWTTPAGSLGVGLLDARPYVTAMPTTGLLPSAPIAPPAGTGVRTVGDVTSSGATGLYRTGSSTVGVVASSRLRGLPAAAGSTGSHTTGVAVPADAIQFEKTPSGEQPPRRRLS